VDGYKEISGSLLGISKLAFILWFFFPHSVPEILLSKEADSDACSVLTKMGISNGIHKDLHF